jgi:hypothetical protein
MTHVTLCQSARKVFSTALTLLILLALAPPLGARAQLAHVIASDEDVLPKPGRGGPLFRLEKIPVEGGAELLTLFGSLNGEGPGATATREVPLVSVLRDTLGDADAENDRLRHVWMLTYTRPTAWQRAASAVPFLYGRVGDKKRAHTRGMPPAVLDLAAPERDVWQRFMWMALQNVVFSPYGVAAKSSSSTFQRNSQRYRQAHILRALAILSLYEHETGEKSPFTPAEMDEIQGRLMLVDKTFGGLMDDAYLERVHQKQTSQWLDTRGHNWELLRQRAEAEGLYFEPLVLPDGEPTHALVWVAREDLEKHRARRFEKRFLNVARPWGDRRLERWDGYVERRFYNADNRPVPEGTAGARAVELIPLALYGLDHPKIPSLLIDFRDGGNPKRREMSHRVIEDVTRNLLALSRFGDVHYFLGRTVFDFVTSRRGMDINQPSRMRAYSQLKLLLSLDATLDRGLRGEIERRIERVSLNPLENDLDAEARLARQQYDALVAYAKRADGLPARLDRDRRAEMVPLAHGRTERILLRTANIATLGLYRHREDAPAAELRAALDRERRLAFHGRFLRRVSKTTPLAEVAYDIEEVRRSLRFVAAAGERGGASTAKAAARIFAQTEDAEARRLCLESLYRINNETAKRELLAIFRRPDLDSELRALSEQYLRDALREEQRISREDAKAILAAVGR